MTTDAYFRKSKLMLQVLPNVAKESCFALKGGTAINLFVQEMPRLSVDIDLAYLQIEEWKASLNNIGAALERIAKDLRLNYKVNLNVGKELVGMEVVRFTKKLSVASGGEVVTIEPNIVFRGSAFPAEQRTLVQGAQDKFEMSISVKTLSEADLYGGKLCAALDRQHPRDIFDVMMLLKNGKIPENIRTAFVVYLASHHRPVHELLNPNLKDIRRLYESDFRGMTEQDVSCEELVECQENLPILIRSQLSEGEVHFLISMKEGKPRWDLLNLDGVENLPALQWKLKNILNMDSEKRVKQLKKLRDVF